VSQIALAWVLANPAISTALVGRAPLPRWTPTTRGRLELAVAERAALDAILAGAAGRVREFTPLRPAMEPWGEELPAGR
jgi:hypothetical protein